MIARTEIETELASAQQISDQLAAARKARGLSQKEVAYTLLLSADQVNCLENRSLKSFYGPQYYVQAAKKYADYLGVTMARLPVPDAPPAAPPAQGITPVPTHSGAPVLPSQSENALSPPVQGRPFSSYRRPLFILASLAAIAASLTFVLLEENRNDHPSGVPAPSTVQEERAVAPALVPQPASAEKPVAVEKPVAIEKPAPAGRPPSASNQGPTREGAPVDAKVDARATAGELQLSFTAQTWVSFYQRDGGHQQKVYQPGETLKLKLEPLTELIIGNAPATRLTVGQTEISLKRFTSTDSNVARIVGQNLRDLGATHPDN